MQEYVPCICFFFCNRTWRRYEIPREAQLMTSDTRSGSVWFTSLTIRIQRKLQIIPASPFSQRRTNLKSVWCTRDGCEARSMRRHLPDPSCSFGRSERLFEMDGSNLLSYQRHEGIESCSKWYMLTLGHNSSMNTVCFMQFSIQMGRNPARRQANCQPINVTQWHYLNNQVLMTG